jgi:STE24 endopeptidase
MIILYPYLILPLFYKKVPFENAEYAAVISETAKKGGISLKKIYQINESRYSKHTNAFFTGFGPEKSIYIYDNLIKNSTPEETASVLAHEIGHWKNKHVLKGVLLSFLGSFFIALLIFFIFPAIIGLKIKDPAGLPLIILIVTVYSYFINPVSSFVSRKFEITADTCELELTGSKSHFISNMTKIAKDNKAFLFPHPIAVFWNASHPPILERIKFAEDFKQVDLKEKR